LIDSAWLTVPLDLDESIYLRTLAEELEFKGTEVKRPGADVPFGSADAAWLKFAGNK
jgi:hypothetical protein